MNAKNLAKQYLEGETPKQFVRRRMRQAAGVFYVVTGLDTIKVQTDGTIISGAGKKALFTRFDTADWRRRNLGRILVGSTVDLDDIGYWWRLGPGTNERYAPPWKHRSRRDRR